MLDEVRKTRVIDAVDPEKIPYGELMTRLEPVILRGQVSHWPLVKAGLESPETAMDYLQRFSGQKKVVSYKGAPEIGGRFAYNNELTGFNYESRRLLLDEFFEGVKQHLGRTGAPSFYIGSTALDSYLPGLREENDLVLNHAMFEDNTPLVSIWLGNRTTAAAHYDLSNNMACCAVGRRRFILFPPEQVHNLYPGPLEPTPGGQAVTMADLHNPDLERYPRLELALAEAQVAEMEPGDLLFYPSMWWHQVEALDEFNAMINYWWNTTPRYMDTPMNTLLHAFLSLRDRPEHEKQAWKALFDYYIFGPSDRAGAHLPEHARGTLGTIDEMAARRLRANLLNRLNR